jgi:hypothetical protein
MSRTPLDDITVSRRKGSAFPEGGMGQSWVVDVCPQCWETKVLPWLKAQGANVEPEEWDTY